MRKLRITLSIIFCSVLMISVFSACTNGNGEEYPHYTESGVYVRHILFGFSDDQHDYIYYGRTFASDEERWEYRENNLIIRDDAFYALVQQRAESQAQYIIPSRGNVANRYLFGEGGIFNDIEAAFLETLDPYNPHTALDIFNALCIIYCNDPGCQNSPHPDHPQAYFVPIEGESPFIEPFTQLARGLFNYWKTQPENTLPLMNRSLAYAVSTFGVHLALPIRSVIVD